MNDFYRQTDPSEAYTLPAVDPQDEAALALLGHDLRAALSDVIGGLRLIEPERLDVLTRVQIERVRASGEVLARLLEQGLTVMLGEAEPATADTINLRRFLTDLDLRWSGRAAELGCGFAMKLRDELPARVRLDRVALDRILSNLIGNALKYCDHGRVVCDVGVQLNGWLCFVVRDDGPGFPEAVLTRQLPFRTRPAGMTQPGTGMGLHIAADLTRRIGGRLMLRNLSPDGAEARMELPLVIVDSPDVPETGGEPLLLGKRVLIADDNLTSQTILSRFVGNLGAEVVVVADGVETVGLLEREVFDLLIVDVEMPRLSGLDVIRCLRGMPGPTARMPVIAVTAYVLRSNRTAILAAGADEMLSKPLLCPHVLSDAVRRAFEVHHEDTLPKQPPRAPLAPTMDDGRLQRLLVMAGPDVADELLDRLLVDLSDVERGLIQASAALDWQGIREHSHVLISLAGTVGGVRLQLRAEELNQLAHKQDRSPLPGLLHEVLTLLDRLIQYVSQVRDDHRSPK